MFYVNDSSRVWHVAKTGNDSNSGHAGQYPVNLANDAKLTVGAAVSAAASGDTVIIWPGDYAENVNAGSKALTFMGTHRTKSRIVPATGSALTLADDCAVMNLGLEALQVADSVVGIKALMKKNILVENCDIYGAYDGVYFSSDQDVIIRNCRVRGKYDGANFGGVSGLIAEDCIFRTDGTFGTSVPARAAWGSGDAIFRNCHFIASRSDNSASIAAGYYIGGVGRHTFQNCVFATTTQSPFAGYVYGFWSQDSNANTAFQNCVFYTSSTGTPGERCDLKNSSGVIVVNGCKYSSSSGTITQADSGWANALAAALFTNGAANKLKIDADGRVDVGSLEGADAELLTRAAKLLLNKAVQDKLTGAIRYYDDDGETVMLTHTPVEDGSSMTRTVS